MSDDIGALKDLLRRAVAHLAMLARRRRQPWWKRRAAAHPRKASDR